MVKEGAGEGGRECFAGCVLLFYKVSGSRRCAGQLLGCRGFLCFFPWQKGPRDECKVIVEPF